MRRMIALAALVALAAAGCSDGSDSSGDESEPTDLSPYAGQEVSWSDCPASDQFLESIPDSAQCAKVNVPVDYFDGSSGRGDVQIALIRIPAQGESQGSLLINPGGPGASGFDTVATSADDLKSHLPGYDIVGFDPRGVGRSVGFDCKQTDDVRLTQIEQDFTPEETTEFEDTYDSTAEYEQACRDGNSAWGFLATPSVARDVSLISQALGDERINFYGISYGSQIGYELLRTYPDRIGRMILESPVDPAVEDTLGDQLAAFNVKLEGLLTDCAEQSSCGRGRSAAQVREAFLKVGADIENPSIATMTSDGHPSEALVYYGLITPMYFEWDAEWQKTYLEALSSLLNENDARYFEYYGYLYNNYDPSKRKFVQTDDIQGLVNCLDESTTEADVAQERTKDQAQIADIQQRAPLFYAVGFSGAYLEDDRIYEPCSYAQAAFADAAIPDPPHDAPAVTNPGTVPVLLLGVSGDTATPYAWAQTISGNLDVPLVTQNTTGHGVYTSGDNACTLDVVGTYLASGTLPAADTTC